MSYVGDFALESTFDFKFNTRRFTTGAPFALASGTLAAYPNNSTTEITAGLTLTADFDSRTGMHNVRVVATAANGYAAGTNYDVVLTAGTVDSVSVVGVVVGQFSIEARSALRPTTAGRTLDVSTGGEAGLDWANVGSPTTTVGLSSTTVGTITTYTGNTPQTGDTFSLIGTPAGASVSADIAAVKADTAAVKVKTDFLPSATAGAAGGVFIAGTNAATTVTTSFTTTFTGDLTGSVGSVTGAVGSVTGSVGSVTGSVGSVTGSVGSISSGGISAASFAANALNAAALAADAVSEIQSGLALEATLDDIKGATFSSATDSLESIRDRGDAAWITGAGGSDRLLLADTTIATLATQTSFTLTAGSDDDDAYNNCTIVVEDVATATQKAVGMVLDYVGSTKTVTLREALSFTIATTDKVYILAENSLKSSVANRQLDVSATGGAGIDWANVENPTTTLALTGTTVASTQQVDVLTIKTQAITASSPITILASVGTAATSIAQTGDSFNLLGTPAGASVSVDIASLQADTDNIQTRLPTALTGAGNIKADVLALNGDATAAAVFATLNGSTVVYQGTVTGSATTTTLIDSGLTQADTDWWKGRIIIFTSVIPLQATAITAFTPGTDQLTFVATTQAPTGATYIII